MSDLTKAKVKAEGFLKKAIDQKWEYTIIEKHNKQVLRGLDEWPLRFEAFTYLSNKNKELIPKFGKEIRSLWRNWIKLNKKGEIGNRKFFWPAIDKYCIPVSHEEADWEPGFEIENHISMFRAKEQMGIEGFESYFDKARKRLCSLLIEEDVLNCSNKKRIIWQIVRSPKLRLSIKNYLNILTSRIIEEELLQKYLYLSKEIDESRKRGIIYEPNLLSQVLFLLSFSNIQGEKKKITIEFLKKMIDMQKDNGSFDENILTTCLAISSIYIMGLDPYGIICKEAVRWLLNKQKEDGIWEHWRIPTISLSLEVHILSTVVVLETIDLVTNDKPLPLWAEKSKIVKGARKKKPSRVQTIRKFPTPSGITWEDISIRFTSSQVVQLRAGESREGRNFIDMGFEDQRSHNPDWSWETLIEFGKNQGEISVDLRQKEIHPRILRNIKYYVMTIRQRLKELFNIKSDPFFNYNRKTKSYKLRCSISVAEELR